MAREILFRESVLGFMSGGKIQPDLGFGSGNNQVSEKGIGHYCSGKDIEECKGYFGNGLAMICNTCPQ
jgi:hypothetical protein